MNTSDFDYDLPQDLIAQEPIEPRDASRLMRLQRHNQTIHHHTFHELVDLLLPGDVLVLNSTRVIPARIFGVLADTGGKLELLLLRKLSNKTWQALVGGKRAVEGTQIVFEGVPITALVIEELAGAERVIEFSEPVEMFLNSMGEMPLPPYIETSLVDPERYQTVYSREVGSAAAPTAGLHFTPELLIDLRRRGIQFAYCELQIGLDTFQPVRVENILDHHIHSERARLNAQNANIINQAKLAGNRIIAVGTTSVRTLETAAILSAGGDPGCPAEFDNICPWRPVIAFDQDTKLFIYPGYRWRVVDAMITNFHLPKSTLLMMIASFAGREFILDAYEAAKQRNYRFYSYGDAMFIE
jgi:S-adenosylmethionine:tRNA ribosyltransferase-isomerase